MIKKFYSQSLAKRFLTNLAAQPEKDKNRLIAGFASWLYAKGYWRKRQEVWLAIKRLWYEQQGITEAIITTSAELTAETKMELVKALEKYFTKKIIPNFRIQLGLIGGLTVETDSQILTFTFQQLLNNLKHSV